MDSDLLSSHLLLVKGDSFETGRESVMHFFRKTVLVKYDHVEIIADESVSAGQSGFRKKLAEGTGRNRFRVEQLLSVLQEEGFSDLGNWLKMPQGYASKTVHEIAHLLDGFFGIDSAFYNLVDDSHWVTERMQHEIDDNPGEYWLIKATGSSHIPEIDRVPFLRRHGTE